MHSLIHSRSNCSLNNHTYRQENSKTYIAEGLYSSNHAGGFWYFPWFWGCFGDFGSNIWDFGQHNVILGFSNKNHAESSINFVKNLILHPKRAKFDQKSWCGHVRTCPGGQILTANQRKYFYFSRNYTFPLLINKFDHFLQNHLFL